MKYPNKSQVIDLLAETARRVAHESSAEHPVDIALAMGNAIEVGGVLIAAANEKGLI